MKIQLVHPKEISPVFIGRLLSEAPVLLNQPCQKNGLIEKDLCWVIKGRMIRHTYRHCHWHCWLDGHESYYPSHDDMNGTSLRSMGCKELTRLCFLWTELNISNVSKKSGKRGTMFNPSVQDLQFYFEFVWQTSLGYFFIDVLLITNLLGLLPV